MPIPAPTMVRTPNVDPISGQRLDGEKWSAEEDSSMTVTNKSINIADLQNEPDEDLEKVAQVVHDERVRRANGGKTTWQINKEKREAKDSLDKDGESK